MRLYTFEFAGQQRTGAERDGRLVDFSQSGILPQDMLSLIRAGEEGLAYARELQQNGQVTRSFAEVRLRAPIPNPGKMLYSGINYRGHLEEEPGAKLPDMPRFFSKLPSAIIGPGDPIVLPEMSRQVDYEVELALVIWRQARNVPDSEMMNYVFGYTIAHDVSARDIQMHDAQETLGKNFDTFAPLGPCLVTKDEIPDPSNLRLRTFINGEMLQDSSTSDWVFPLPRLLGALNRVMTLQPGDVVTTGCPAGVGYFRRPQIFLKPGDVCRLEIEKIGLLENPVMAEVTPI